MKKALLGTILGLSLIACPIVYFTLGPSLSQNQLDTLIILLIISGASALYCFIVGEISHNNSQMDKLWSILPEIYLWIIAIRGGMQPRLVVMAILGTLWGIRLTYNFALKGAYKLKFWTGKEDYRWVVLREKKEFQPHWKWMLFNFFFISIYQNLLILTTTFPALVSMESTIPFNFIDIIAAVLMSGFIILEMIADIQQWKFQSKKWKLINEGNKLEDLPHPYNKGFNTTGLWAFSRHPNYLGEQGTWASLFLFSIAALGRFNWSFIGAVLLIVLFLGSSTFQEEISKSKYKEYSIYCKKVSRYIPWKKYKSENTK